VLVTRLLQQGWPVRIIARRPLPDGFFSHPVEVVVGDVADPHVVGQAVAGVEIIFHLAALLHISNPSSEAAAEYVRVNVGATRALIEAAQKEDVRRLIFFSTIAVYGPTPGIVADETTLPQPDTLYAETKIEAEQLALAARRVDGQPLASILRLAAVYGARMKGNLPSPGTRAGARLVRPHWAGA
jgi:UDP-glucose 4-epimerase